MAVITERAGERGTSYQVKVRKAGYPTMSKTFKTRADAIAWGQEQELAIYKGQTVATNAGSTETIGKLVERYLAEVVPLKKGKDREEFAIRSIENSPLVKYTVSTLTPEAIRKWRDDLLRGEPEKEGGRKPNSRNTVIRKMGILHHIIEHARKEWGISGGPNPMDQVTRPEAPPGRDRRLMEGEEAKLLAEAARLRNDYLHDVIVLALETGMRASEIIYMRWSQLNTTKQTYRLSHSETKNGMGRVVPLSSKAVELLKVRKAHAEAAAAASQPRKAIDPRVFPGLTREAVTQRFRKAAEAVGIEDLRFHDLRHEAASRFSEKGFSTVELSVFTGHKDPRMVRRYAHPDPEKLAARLG